jgi:hypothetical protein
VIHRLPDDVGDFFLRLAGIVAVFVGRLHRSVVLLNR